MERKDIVMRRILKHLFMVCMLLMLTGIPAALAPQLNAEAASAETAKVTLNNPPSFRLTQYLNKGFVVKWGKVKGASGYEIFAKTDTSKKYVKVGETKNCAFQLTNRKEVNKQYTIAVRAYKDLKNGERAVSKFSTLKATLYKIAIEEIHGRYVSTTFKSNTTVTILDTGKKAKVRAGTKATAIKRTGNTNTLILSNGVKVSAPRSNLSFGNLITTTKYYTTAQKELYVNAKGFSSPTKYLIYVNQYTLNATIFKGSKGKWKVVRSMPCVVGRYGKTPTGVMRIKYKVTNLYGSYGLYFTGNIGYGNAFHRLMDGNTRGALSGGCIRLAADDLYFMYMNCPVGTTVVSY